MISGTRKALGERRPPPSASGSPPKLNHL